MRVQCCAILTKFSDHNYNSGCVITLLVFDIRTIYSPIFFNDPFFTISHNFTVFYHMVTNTLTNHVCSYIENICMEALQQQHQHLVVCVLMCSDLLLLYFMMQNSVVAGCSFAICARNSCLVLIIFHSYSSNKILARQRRKNFILL